MIDTATYAPNNPSPNSPRNSPSLAGSITTINDMLVALEESLLSGYFREAANVGRASADSISISGDQTSRYRAKTIVRLNSSPALVGIVQSAVFSGGNTLVTVTGVTVPDPLITLDVAVMPKGGELLLTNSDISSGGTFTNPTIVNPAASNGTYTDGVFNSPEINNPDIVGGVIDEAIINDADINDSTINTSTLINPIIQASRLVVVNLGNVSGTTNINFAAGNYFILNPTAATTLVALNAQPGMAVTLAIRTQQSLSWFTTIRWDENIVPTRSATADRYDLFHVACLLDTGGGARTYLGSMIGRNRTI